MIFELLCDALYQIVTTLLFFIEIPAFDDFDTLYSIIGLAVQNGANIFNFFIGGSYVSLLFEVWASVYLMMISYDLIMWILRKIPGLNIK